MSTIYIPYTAQPRQQLYHNTTDIDELLYGGAAGGGKSLATIMDALKYGLDYPGSRQAIFRRTFPDLNRSIVAEQLKWYPKKLASYNKQDKLWTLLNGSTIEVAYWDDDGNYTNYQGAQYDVIRWEELTQFEERWYTYMLSRCRGEKPYPRSVKSTTNPGGIGHSWVKKRFIDIGPPEQIHTIMDTDEDGNQLYYPQDHPKAGQPIKSKRVFIPAKVSDNKKLMENDPEYVARLMRLSEQERKQLLDGDWDTFAGQYFGEWNRSIHVVKPFEIPVDWKRYRALDEGYYPDPFVSLWIAMDRKGNAYLYRELSQTKLLTRQQVERVKQMSPENIDYSVADTSFWNKSKETGESPAEVFAKEGVPLLQATKERLNGWKRLREWLHVYDEVDPVTGSTYKTARLKVFSTCLNAIEAIPAMVHDDTHSEDMADHPLDHIPDALRYWSMSRPSPTRPLPKHEDTSMEAKVQRNIQSLSKKQKGMKAL
jgi:hypothetical protein